jgi:hypothetical protein
LQATEAKSICGHRGGLMPALQFPTPIVINPAIPPPHSIDGSDRTLPRPKNLRI